MKIQYLEIFFSRHFSDSIEDAYIREKYKQVLTLSDTCSAGTLFYTTTARNGMFYGSSGWDMYSLSEGFDKYIGQPLKDRFSYRFQKWVKTFNGNKQYSFQDFLSTSPLDRVTPEKFPKEALLSESMHYNNMGRPDSKVNFNSFFKSSKPTFRTVNLEDDLSLAKSFFA